MKTHDTSDERRRLNDITAPGMGRSMGNAATDADRELRAVWLQMGRLLSDAVEATDANVLATTLHNRMAGRRRERQRRVWSIGVCVVAVAAVLVAWIAIVDPLADKALPQQEVAKRVEMKPAHPVLESVLNELQPEIIVAATEPQPWSDDDLQRRFEQWQDDRLALLDTDFGDIEIALVEYRLSQLSVEATGGWEVF